MIYELAFKLFRKPALELASLFKRLEPELRRARILIPAEKYGAFILFSSTLAFALSFLSLNLAAALLFGFSWLNFVILSLASGGIFALVFLFTFFWPRMQVGERRKRIENTIAFATIYLATLARSGFPAHSLFTELAGVREYKEIALEAEKIANDIEGLGLDISTALRAAMARSPSPQWTELLAGLRSTVMAGGDLASYLKEKAKGFIAEYKRRIEEFGTTCETLIHFYITLVFVGGIFLIVITSIMVAIGGVPPFIARILNYAVIFLGLPGLTACLILILKGLSPFEK